MVWRRGRGRRHGRIPWSLGSGRLVRACGSFRKATLTSPPTRSIHTRTSQLQCRSLTPMLPMSGVYLVAVDIRVEGRGGGAAEGSGMDVGRAPSLAGQVEANLAREDDVHLDRHVEAHHRAAVVARRGARGRRRRRHGARPLLGGDLGRRRTRLLLRLKGLNARPPFLQITEGRLPSPRRPRPLGPARGPRAPRFRPARPRKAHETAANV
jgi:hypothetical protein